MMHSSTVGPMGQLGYRTLRQAAQVAVQGVLRAEEEKNDAFIHCKPTWHYDRPRRLLYKGFSELKKRK